MYFLGGIKIKEEQGATLFEIIIVVAVVTLIMMISYSLITTGYRVVWRGSEQARVQSEVRMISGFINDKLIYADELEIANSASTSFPGSIYFQNNTGVVITDLHRAGIERIYGRQLVEDDFDITLEFDYDDSRDGILEYKIEVYDRDGDLFYDLESEIHLKNYGQDDTDLENFGTGEVVNFNIAS